MLGTRVLGSGKLKEGEGNSWPLCPPQVTPGRWDSVIVAFIITHRPQIKLTNWGGQGLDENGKKRFGHVTRTFKYAPPLSRPYLKKRGHSFIRTPRNQIGKNTNSKQFTVKFEASCLEHRDTTGIDYQRQFLLQG